MANDGGLPDYIADHFQYLVRCSRPARLAQLTFYALAIVMALGAPLLAPSLLGHPTLFNRVILLGSGIGFAASFLWYVGWYHERQSKFKTEMPSSYARWFGLKRRGPFGGMSFSLNMQLAKLQMRYLLFSREPSSSETLALSMAFARHSLV